MFDFFNLFFTCKNCGRTVDDGSIVRKLCNECLDKENPYNKLVEEMDRRIDILRYDKEKKNNENDW